MFKFIKIVNSRYTPGNGARPRCPHLGRARPKCRTAQSDGRVTGVAGRTATATTESGCMTLTRVETLAHGTSHITSPLRTTHNIRCRNCTFRLTAFRRNAIYACFCKIYITNTVQSLSFFYFKNFLVIA